jgi:hypothetical protein
MKFARRIIMKVSVELMYLKNEKRVSKEGREYNIASFLSNEMEHVDLNVRKADVLRDLEECKGFDKVKAVIDITRNRYGVFVEVVSIKKVS